MKRILITGAGSYVGTSVAAHLGQWPERYQVDALNMHGDGWRQQDFSAFDAVLHVAGIVHQPPKKNNAAQAALYEQVNTRLAIDTAKKAKQEGVGQFLFMSTASVYGLEAPIARAVTITADTPLNPKDYYGISKLKAEEGLARLKSEGFRIAILRPPMVYGKGCRGNYRKLSELAQKLPVFPWVENERSMIYMENLAEFIRLLIDDEAQGTFCPQDAEYVSTCDMVSRIARCHGKEIRMLRGTAWGLRLLRLGTPMVDKAFGSLCYDRSLSSYPRDYCLKSLEQAIRETESA